MMKINFVWKIKISFLIRHFVIPIRRGNCFHVKLKTKYLVLRGLMLMYRVKLLGFGCNLLVKMLFYVTHSFRIGDHKGSKD